jgi:hypothetical protein
MEVITLMTLPRSEFITSMSLTTSTVWRRYPLHAARFIF